MLSLFYSYLSVKWNHGPNRCKTTVEPHIYTFLGIDEKLYKLLESVNCRKCKNHKLSTYLHLKSLLECSANNAGKLLSIIWRFLKHSCKKLKICSIMMQVKVICQTLWKFLCRIILLKSNLICSMLLCIFFSDMMVFWLSYSEFIQITKLFHQLNMSPQVSVICLCYVEFFF
jgi:hypothetical protein